MPAEKQHPWKHNRPYNAYNEYFRTFFGGRIQKLSIDAGFNCPNRDGSKGTGGCTFCNNNAFSPSYCQPAKPISQQITEGIAFHRKRYRQTKGFLAYFQSYSNTYANLEVLRAYYDEALQHEEVVGLVIGTRPDAVNEAILDHLATLSSRYYIIIEYGLESCYNETLRRVNRGHTFEESLQALEMTASRGIRQGAHFIIGLPGESEEEILAQTVIISQLPVQNVKFHQLQIVKNTPLAREYSDHPEHFHLFGLDEYLDLMVRFVEKLNPSIVLERIAGESNPGYLIAPLWNLRYEAVVKQFEQLLLKRNTWQGKYFES